MRVECLQLVRRNLGLRCWGWGSEGRMGEDGKRKPHSHGLQCLLRVSLGLGTVPGAGWRNRPAVRGQWDGQRKEVTFKCTRDLSVFVSEGQGAFRE